MDETINGPVLPEEARGILTDLVSVARRGDATVSLFVCFEAVRPACEAAGMSLLDMTEALVRTVGENNVSLTVHAPA